MTSGMDRRLSRFFAASTDEEAVHALDRLLREHVHPVVRGVLAFELRRGKPTTQAELDDEDESFTDIENDVLVRLCRQFWKMRQQVSKVGATTPIQDICSYAGATARNACTDYLRRKYPGRHTLDMALRDALRNPGADPTLWETELGQDLKEWRCGWREWRDEDKEPVSLLGNPPLRSALQEMLTQLPRSEAVPAVCRVVGAPVRYQELLGLLAKAWDVETPYRVPELRLPPYHGESEQPESAVLYLSWLVEIWEAIARLALPQRIAILLHEQGFRVLQEMLDRRVVTSGTVARALEISSKESAPLLSGGSLTDEQIARHFILDAERVRGHRQDGYRRLARILQEKKSENG